LLPLCAEEDVSIRVSLFLRCLCLEGEFSRSQTRDLLGLNYRKRYNFKLLHVLFDRWWRYVVTAFFIFLFLNTYSFFSLNNLTWAGSIVHTFPLDWPLEQLTLARCKYLFPWRDNIIWSQIFKVKSSIYTIHSIGV